MSSAGTMRTVTSATRVKWSESSTWSRVDVVSLTYGTWHLTVTYMIKDLRLNVTEIHNADLVSDPNGTISRLCTTLQIQCTEEYLKLCSDKVYDSPSKTRHLIKWTPGLKQLVELKIQGYEFLHRYSFDD